MADGKKKPLWKRWWFWVGLVVLFFVYAAHEGGKMKRERDAMSASVPPARHVEQAVPTQGEVPARPTAESEPATAKATEAEVPAPSENSAPPDEPAPPPEPQPDVEDERWPELDNLKFPEFRLEPKGKRSNGIGGCTFSWEITELPRRGTLAVFYATDKDGNVVDSTNELMHGLTVGDLIEADFIDARCSRIADVRFKLR